MQQAIDTYDNQLTARFSNINLPRKSIVGIILVVALLAFEIFNFDTTRYALRSLLGDVNFLGLQWAGILAIAFCSIDFAGLVRLFTPEKGMDEPKEVWYLMGAWLLGATMNAVMTWWAVSLTLLNHDFGNEVLSREQLLRSVPIFVAVLVWLTRILFIGAFTVAGEHIFDMNQTRQSRPAAARSQQPTRAAQSQPITARPNPVRSTSAPVATTAHSRQTNGRQYNPRSKRINPVPKTVSAPVAENTATFLDENQTVITNGSGRPVAEPSRPSQNSNSRIKQRPPMPGRATANGRNSRVQARTRNK